MDHVALLDHDHVVGDTRDVKILTLPYLVLNDPATKTFAYKLYLKYLNQVGSDHGFGLNAGPDVVRRPADRTCGGA